MAEGDRQSRAEQRRAEQHRAEQVEAATTNCKPAVLHNGIVNLPNRFASMLAAVNSWLPQLVTHGLHLGSHHLQPLRPPA